MNNNSGRIGFTALLLSTGLLFVIVANAEDAKVPAPSGSVAAASSDAGMADSEFDGDANGDADASPPSLPAFDEKPFPEEKSPRPKKDDWKNAPTVALSDGSTFNMCKVQRLREWIRMSCEITTAQITLMCGNAEDVYLELGTVPPDWGTFPEGGEIVFPVRKGDRRLFEWQGVEFGYRGSNSVNSFVAISELWLPGEEKPVIVAR